jgi:hypothetical protein
MSAGQLLWGLLLFLDLWALARPPAAVRPEAGVYRPSDCVARLGTGQRVLDRDAPGLEAATPLGGGAPLALIAGLEPLRGYNPLVNRRYMEYLQFIAGVWYPGWTCTVDGRATPLYRADYLFRAVELPEGAREVVFTFEPASYRRGRAVSLAALVLVLLIGLASAVGAARALSRKRLR